MTTTNETCPDVCPDCGAGPSAFSTEWGCGSHVKKSNTWGGYQSPRCQITCLTKQLADANGKLANTKLALENLRQYQAAEGYEEDSKVIGLSYRGSDIWGFTHDPNYQSWELLETTEKWLHKRLDSILAIIQRKSP